MAHAALKELFPARVIPFEQPVAAAKADHLSTPSSDEISRSSVQDGTGAPAPDPKDLAYALEVLAQAGLSRHVQEAEVQRLAARVDEAIEQFQSELRQAENSLKEAEKRAQDAERRAAEAEQWLQRMYDEIMRQFRPVQS